MTPLGSAIETLPIALTQERVVESFDGPLLVLHRNHAGEPYLEMWVDRDGAQDRWFIFRISELELIHYEFQRRTLKQTLLDARDGYVFVRDVEVGHPIRLSTLAVASIPVGYLPKNDSFHDQSLNPSLSADLDEQIFMIDFDWDTDTFRDVDRKYDQVYSFMASFGKARIGNPIALQASFATMTFDSGWNYKTAFDRLRLATPVTKRAKVSEVQYASPGLVRFRVDGQVASTVRSAINVLYDNPKELWKKYDLAHDIILDMGRNADLYKADPKLLASREQSLRSSVKDLAEILGTVDGDSLLAAAGSAYIAGELLVTFVRRMSSLRDYDAGGTAELAGIQKPDVDDDD